MGMNTSSSPSSFQSWLPKRWCLPECSNRNLKFSWRRQNSWPTNLWLPMRSWVAHHSNFHFLCFRAFLHLLPFVSCTGTSGVDESRVCSLKLTRNWALGEDFISTCMLHARVRTIWSCVGWCFASSCYLREADAFEQSIRVHSSCTYDSRTLCADIYSASHWPQLRILSTDQRDSATDIKTLKCRIVTTSLLPPVCKPNYGRWLLSRSFS